MISNKTKFAILGIDFFTIEKERYVTLKYVDFTCKSKPTKIITKKIDDLDTSLKKEVWNLGYKITEIIEGD